MTITKLASAVALLVAAGCGKSDDARPEKTADPVAGEETPEKAELDVGALAEGIGVAPGTVSREGPGIAAVTAVKGSVAVRKLGEELFAPAGVAAELHAGDQLVERLEPIERLERLSPVEQQADPRELDGLGRDPSASARSRAALASAKRCSADRTLAWWRCRSGLSRSAAIISSATARAVS